MAFGTNINALLGGLSNPYGVGSIGEWSLARGVYTPKGGDPFVFFYETKANEPRDRKTALEQITDSGGRRIAVYEYPYRDGQKLRDLGRRGETLTFNIKFHGSNYQQSMKDFLRVLVNSREGGSIVHPIRGAINVRYRDHEFVHRHDEWNAITIKAVFLEDNTDALTAEEAGRESADAAMRSTLQLLTKIQNDIASSIFSTNSSLLLPGSVGASLQQRLDLIVNQVSGLLGRLGVSFSSDAKIQSLAAQASSANLPITKLTSGTINSPSGNSQKLPPVFQVGLDPITQATVTRNEAAFSQANQITPQQAVFSANQARQSIGAAIVEAQNAYGSQAYDIVLSYRTLAVAIQSTTEASIAQSRTQVFRYTVPRPMSLRMIAKLNNLSYQRQNDIEALNPYLASVNYVPAGTIVTVPVA